MFSFLRSVQRRLDAPRVVRLGRVRLLVPPPPVVSVVERHASARAGVLGASLVFASGALALAGALYGFSVTGGAAWASSDALARPAVMVLFAIPAAALGVVGLVLLEAALRGRLVQDGVQG